MSDTTPDLRIKLRLDYGPALTLGPGKAELLEGIGQLGSISAAGRRMGMSYKRAWSLVDGMNRSFAAPLVSSERGGAGGGGAALTPAGHEVLTRFRQIAAAAHDCAHADMDALLAMRSGE